MKIFSAAQVKEWDAYSIKNEPINSINLMERAATACYRWLVKNEFAQKHFRIFCGKGNNGGDGLALARLLIQNNCRVTVYILEFGKIGTEDFQLNLERLHQCTTDIHFIQSTEFFPTINKDDVIVDALFGIGLNKPLDGISAQLVQYLNLQEALMVSIDMPTGLFTDKASTGNTIINATHTLSFQNYKLALLLPENETYCGQVHLLEIGLHKLFEDNEASIFEMIDRHAIKNIFKPRSNFAHKGNYGHAVLLCGSYGMMGAAVLSSLGCLKSGVGKLTACVPQCGYQIMQATVPEAMCEVEGENFIQHPPSIEKFDAVGIGPGIGLFPSHKELLQHVFSTANKPIVIDADALNIIAQEPSLFTSIPAGSIITPHPKEFERLFGKTQNNFERLQLALAKANEFNIFIVLKGHYSFIACSGQKGYFNSTGNPGMATAGSGDVLTGILTGLLAQGYDSMQACMLGVYVHGLAGDIAAGKYSQEAMTAGNIADCMGDAFKMLYP